MQAAVLSQVSFGLESAWGTAITPNKSLAVHTGDGLQTDNDIQFINAIKAQLAKNADSYKGKVKHSGDFEFDFIPGVSGYLLKSLFGNCSSALKAGESVVYQHTYTESATKPSLTIEQAVDQIVRRFSGSIVNSLKLSCKAGESLVATAGIIAKSAANATAITPSYETIRPFNFNDCLTASGFKIGGTAYGELDNIELEIKMNGNMLHAMGSNDPSFFGPGASEVTGKAELYMDNATAAKFADYLAKTDRSIDLAFTGDAIGTASNYGLSISIPRVTFKSSTDPIRDDYNIITLEFEGVYDATTSKLLSSVMTNLTANYN